VPPSIKFAVICQDSIASSEVKFINILCKALTHEDLKSAKKTDNLTLFFALLGFECIKAARKMFVKLTPGANRSQIERNTCKNY